MKTRIFVTFFLQLLWLPIAYSQLSEKDKTLIIEYYASRFDHRELRNMINVPENAEALISCLAGVKKINAMENVKSELEEDRKTKVANLDRIYRNLGINVSDAYSREIMPGFNWKNYINFIDNMSSADFFTVPDMKPGSTDIYGIGTAPYRSLINTYSRDRSRGVLSSNVITELLFNKAELLESLQKQVNKVVSKDYLYSGNDPYFFVVRWLEFAHYENVKANVLARIKKDLVLEKEKMSICDQKVGNLLKTTADQKDGESDVLVITEEDTDPEPKKDKPVSVPGKPSEKKPPTAAPQWEGTYIDRLKRSTIRISGSAAFYTGSFEYESGDAKGTGGSFENCKVEGNKMTGTWKIQHTDKTKSGDREGTFEITLSADGIVGTLLEGKDPKWQYKEGYNAQNVNSEIIKGARATIDSVREK